MLQKSGGFTAERRNHTRLPITSLVFIDLGDGNGGLMLDLSEGGATVQVTEILVDGLFERMRFRLPNAENWIEASGRLVWQRRSQREAGIQFVELAEDACNQIKNWVSLETLRPSNSTKKGRFKIVWEAEDSSPTCIPTAAGDRASSLGYDPAMFPSERSASTYSADSVDRMKMPSRRLNTSTDLAQSPRPTRVPFVRCNEPPITKPNPLVRANDAPKQAAAESEVPRRRASWERRSGSRSAEILVPFQAGCSNYGSQFDLSSLATSLGVDDVPQGIPADSLGQSTGTFPESELQALEDTNHANSRSFLNELSHARQTTGGIWTSDSFPNSDSPSEFRREQLDSEMPAHNGWILPAVIVLAASLGLGALMIRESSNWKSAGARLEGSSVHGIADSLHLGTLQDGETISNAADATSRTQSPPDTLTPQSLSPAGSVSKRAEHQSAAPKHTTRVSISEIDQRGQSLSPPRLPKHTKPPETEQSLVGAPPLGVAGGSIVQPPLLPEAIARASTLPAAPNDRTLDAYAEQNQRATIQASEKWQRFVPPQPHAWTADAAAAQTSSVVPSAPQDSQSGSGTVDISSHFHAIKEVANSELQPSRAGGNLQIGQLISIRQPAYPQNAARQRIEGMVRLRAIVGTDGTVRAVELVRGPLELVPAATSAVWTWRYERTLLDGQPVESEEDITLLFRLTHIAAFPRWNNLR